jgi:hypothetical protein
MAVCAVVASASADLAGLGLVGRTGQISLVTLAAVVSGWLVLSVEALKKRLECRIFDGVTAVDRPQPGHRSPARSVLARLGPRPPRTPARRLASTAAASARSSAMPYGSPSCWCPPPDGVGSGAARGRLCRRAGAAATGSAIETHLHRRRIPDHVRRGQHRPRGHPVRRDSSPSWLSPRTVPPVSELRSHPLVQSVEVGARFGETC